MLTTWALTALAIASLSRVSGHEQEFVFKGHMTAGQTFRKPLQSVHLVPACKCSVNSLDPTFWGLMELAGGELQPSPQPNLLVRKLVVLEECQSHPQEGEHNQLRHGRGQTDGSMGADTDGLEGYACLQPQPSWGSADWPAPPLPAGSAACWADQIHGRPHRQSGALSAKHLFAPCHCKERRPRIGA